MLNGVSAVNENSVWAVGERGTVLFYSGGSWQSRESGITEMLYSVTAADNENVWAAVPTGVPGAGIFFFDGSHWGIQYEITDDGAIIVDLYDISAVDANNVWVASSSGIYCGSK